MCLICQNQTICQKMKRKEYICVLCLIIACQTLAFGQKRTPQTGPVFEDMGPVFDIPDLDNAPDSESILKAIFDIDRLQKEPSQANPLILSLHRYYNMHVRAGVPKENIYLAFVLHGKSTKNALNDAAYEAKYGIKNPNTTLIKALAKEGVHMYICGQSASFAGYSKDDLMPEIKLALSAMTVLTTYQMDGYAMIKF